jgi:hypothetical protein
VFAFAVAAPAADPTDGEIARDDEIAELRQKLDTVVGELESLRAQIGAPTQAEDAELEPRYGYGPGAAKIYSLGRGVSLGGYAEASYRRCCWDSSGGGNNEFDMTRVVAYIGYKFTDRIVFNTEIEFEHVTTEQAGSVNVEFATLDFLWKDELNFRVGNLLLPMGLINEVHEPPFYYGTRRPQTEQVIIPTTWHENGGGVFGRLGESVQYRVYVINGFDVNGYESSGLREARQDGSEALANDLAFVSRLDWDALPGLRLGGSYYVGGSGQDQSIDAGGTEQKLPNARTSIWELHAEYRLAALTARALFARARVADAGQLSELFTLAGNEQPVIAESMFGGYAEIAYDVIPYFFPGSEMSLEPFFRFEYVDTQDNVPSGFIADRTFKQRIYTPGIQFKPIPNVVLKLDYRNVDSFGGDVGDEVSFGFGLVF